MRAYLLDLAGNYSHHRKYETTGWLCQACNLGVREDQDHVTQCNGYSNLIQDKNLDEDADLVTFYKSVMTLLQHHMARK